MVMGSGNSKGNAVIHTGGSLSDKELRKHLCETELIKEIKENRGR